MLHFSFVHSLLYAMMRRTATAAAGLCLLLAWTPVCVFACGSCLGSLALSSAGITGSTTNPTSRHRNNPHPRHRHHAPSSAAATAASKKTPAGGPVSKSALGLIAARHILSQMDRVAALKPRIFASDSSSSSDEDALEDMLSDDDTYETPEQRGVDPECMARSKEGRMTAGMTGAIGFYKGWISPILPPACRFVPTCSQYGVQAIQEFGPTKGAVLTAWRLMRCSPLGGKGYDPLIFACIHIICCMHLSNSPCFSLSTRTSLRYDPPRWPPVPYNYASY